MVVWLHVGAAAMSREGLWWLACGCLMCEPTASRAAAVVPKKIVTAYLLYLLTGIRDGSGQEQLDQNREPGDGY